MPSALEVAQYLGLNSPVKDEATLSSNVTAGVHNQNNGPFKGSSFLENAREASQTNRGIAAGLQQKLVNDVLKCNNITIDNPDSGTELIRDRISSAKILLVINDLDGIVPLEFLEGPFIVGSTIIITTRHEDLLDPIDEEAKYKVKELGDFESRQLFCQHGFGGDNEMLDTFSELSKEILELAGGLQLALKVRGSALIKDSEGGWICFIDKLRQVSIAGVEEILLICFDALGDPLKAIFLDIACFFIGREEEDVVQIMETCYASVNYYIGILKKKEKHSRLWVPEIIHEVLNENKGTEAIEGMIPSNFGFFRNFNPFSEDSLEHLGRKSILASKSRQYDAETFKRMRKLRYLYLQKVNLTGSFEHKFKELRWLYWERCPLWYLPSDFCPQKLVFLALHGSKIKTMCAFSRGSQVFKNLKTLDMRHSFDLTTISDFTRLPCLETLNLKCCKRLEEVHHSIGSLARLVYLNLGGCSTLKGLPGSICNLKALKRLRIWSCINLKSIPRNFGNIESLVKLDARWLNLCKLPDSIGCLSLLVKLNLSSCEKLITLPDTICDLRSLNILDIGRCSSLEALPARLGNLESLVELRAGNLIVSELPNSIGRLSKLVKLFLSWCHKLKTLPDTICNLKSLEIPDIYGCTSLEALPSEFGKLESLVHLRAGELQSCINLLSIAELPSSLKYLTLECCESMERLPNLSNLKQLEDLILRGCRSLTEIQGLEELTSIQNLHFGGCNSSLLKSTFTKRLFQIYSEFGHQIKFYAPPSVFTDWISRSADWISKTSNSVSTVSLDLPEDLSQNFLAMILFIKSSSRGRAVSSVKTTTNNISWSFRYTSSYYDDYQDISCMDIVPRSIFSVTDDDDIIEFTASLEVESSGIGMPFTRKLEIPEILGIHLVYKPETDITDEGLQSSIDEEIFFEAVETFGM
ncbi:hypothetical protein ACET3Z_004207 [Daucus carota]